MSDGPTDAARSGKRRGGGRKKATKKEPIKRKRKKGDFAVFNVVRRSSDEGTQSEYFELVIDDLADTQHAKNWLKENAETLIYGEDEAKTFMIAQIKERVTVGVKTVTKVAFI